MLNQQMAQLERFLAKQLKQGNYLTRRSIEKAYLDEIKMSRRQFEKVIERLVSAGRVIDSPLLEAHRLGGRQTYLHPETTAPLN